MSIFQKSVVPVHLQSYISVQAMQAVIIWYWREWNVFWCQWYIGKIYSMLQSSEEHIWTPKPLNNFGRDIYICFSQVKVARLGTGVFGWNVTVIDRRTKQYGDLWLSMLRINLYFHTFICSTDTGSPFVISMAENKSLDDLHPHMTQQKKQK